MTYRFRSLLWLGLWLIAVLVPLLYVAAKNSIHAFNADAIAYLRTAQYYSEGRFDLAVNGYWGPLFSWLCVPFLNTSDNPVVTARIVMAISAVVFLIGSLVALAGLRLKLVRIGLAAFLIALFSVSFSVAVIEPDLLMNGFLLTGFGLSVSASNNARAQHPFLSGLAYGLAFLTKAVALPIAVGLIVVLVLVRLYAGDIDRVTAGRLLRWAAAGFGILALPWITVLSLHYGKPTFSTSGKIGHAVVGPHIQNFGPNVGPYKFLHPHDYMYLRPEPGRIATMEEPSREPYRYWSPFQSRDAFIYQLDLISRNLRTVAQILGFGKLGYVVAIVVAGLVFFWPGPWWSQFKQEPWRLAIPAIALLAGIYLPFYAEDRRYFIACYPLLLAVVFGSLDNLAEKSAYRAMFKAVLPVLVSVVFLSVIIWDGLEKAVVQGERSEGFAIAEKIAPLLRDSPPSGIASAHLRGTNVGLYTAFLAGIPYYGNRYDVGSAEDVLESGAELLFVDQASDLNADLKNHRRLRQIDRELRQRIGEAGDWGINIYRVLPGK